MKPIIQTASGKFVSLTDPRPEDIVLADIARALSNLSRFTGHVGFYSVAEHSVGVAFLTEMFYSREYSGGFEKQAFKAGLFHDATEAYVGDVSSPLKSLLPGYQSIEKRFHEVISAKFSLHVFKVGGADLVKAADLAMLELERQRFFGREPDPAWPGFLPGFEVTSAELETVSDGALGAFDREPAAAWNLFVDATGRYGLP